MSHLQQGAKVLGKKALQTGAQVAQDVLEGNNVNTALAKRSKEAIGGLVPQAGSGQETKNSCVGSRPRRISTLVVNLCGTPLQNYKILIPAIFNHFTTMSRLVKNNLPSLHLLTLLPRTSASFFSRDSHPRTDTRISSNSF